MEEDRTTLPLVKEGKRVVDPDEWGMGSADNDETYRKWTRFLRSYRRWFTMWTRDCRRCDDPIRSGEPYHGYVYAEALATPVRDRKGKLRYSRLFTEYEHLMCPRDMDDAEAFHREMEREREEAERAAAREAA